MHHGLFGKLPAKRDFIAVNVRRAFLDCWEPWVQSSRSASEAELDAEWLAAYQAAPIWRFWLGSAICAESTIGAFIPSYDGLGRCYPLTLVARGDFAPPEYHARDDWFAGAEAFLRSAVGNTQNYDRTLTALGELAEPSSGWPDSAGAKAVAVPGGVAVVGTAAATTTFAELRMASHSLLFANSSFWWTGGNAHNPPQALLATGLPAATLMSAMLTGRWPDAPHVASQGE